jgi:hypothetical protein
VKRACDLVAKQYGAGSGCQLKGDSKRRAIAFCDAGSTLRMYVRGANVLRDRESSDVAKAFAHSAMNPWVWRSLTEVLVNSPEMAKDSVAIGSMTCSDVTGVFPIGSFSHRRWNSTQLGTPGQIICDSEPFGDEDFEIGYSYLLASFLVIDDK